MSMETLTLDQQIADVLAATPEYTRPALRLVSGRPIVLVANSFATDAEIDHLLTLAAGDADLLVAPDVVLSRLAASIEEAFGIANLRGTMMEFRTSDCPAPAAATDGPQLLATATLFLENGPGGGLHFPGAPEGPLSVKAVRGRLVLCFNRRLDGTEEPAAEPVSTGLRKSLTLRIYNHLSALLG